MSRAVFTYGRFNPPTMGHDVLIDKLKSIASGDPVFVFTSQSNDPRRNPFSYKQKTKYMKKAFRGVTVVDSPKIKNMFDAITMLGKKYDEIVMVVGGDRVASIKRSAVGSARKLGINMSVQSAGARDPDAEGSKGMSASKMRAAAARDDYSAFMKGCPASLSKKDCLNMFKELRMAMNIKEDWFDNEDFKLFCESYLTEPQILDRLVQQLKDRGFDKNRAFAIATSQLQKAGVLKKGTQDLTKKGEKRQSMGAAGRAKDRAAKKDNNKPSDYKYNSRTNIATLKDSMMNEDKKPLMRWMDNFEKELKKRGGSYKTVDPVDALKMYYKGVDPKKAAAQLKESRSQFDVDASPMIRKYIEQGKGIVASANSTLGGNSKFVVMKRPTAMGRAGQDQFMMATISDPKKGRIKMFSYHGTHPSKDGAMKMAKSRKLAESVKLEEKKDPTKIVSGKISKLKDKERDLLASAINMSGADAPVMANRVNVDMFNDGSIIPAMTFLRKNMSSLTPEGKKLGKTILKVLGEAVELDESSLPAYDARLLRQALVLGKNAFKAGKKREPIKDPNLKKLRGFASGKGKNDVMKQWLKGWDEMNLKDDVQEAMADRKVVSTPSLGSMNAPSSNFRMNLPPTGKMKKQMQQIMKKDASYRRKMSNLVQKSETQKDGTITLHFSSARKRTSFQKLLHQGIKEGICEVVDKDDTKFAKKLVKNLRKGSKTHAKQADDLEKAINDARDYKKEYENYHSKPEQRANRSKRVLARREMIKNGRAAKGDGKDVDHKDGNPQNNSPSNLRMMSVNANRGRNNNKNEEGGAGDMGTDALLQKYRRETPGQ